MPTLVKDARRVYGVNDLVNAGFGGDRVLVAFDPGISGATAFHTVETGHLLIAEDLPVVAGQVDAVSLADRLSEMKPVAAFIERVGAMPKQGVASTFKFAQANGVLIGILAALHVPMHFITPGVWKKHYGLDADKEKSRLKALQLFPESRSY
jgi:Holliday junction resolvasome RuvABC endonuclease subunit